MHDFTQQLGSATPHGLQNEGVDEPVGAMPHVENISDAMFSFDFSLDILAYNLGALLVAFVLALPIAWDREKKKSSPGLRTIPLVSMASCAYVLVAISILSGSPDAHARMLQGLVTGVGFVGGGAILKSTDRVTGTATAASIWAMGALGAAVAYRRLEIALLLAMVTFATLRWLKPLKKVAGTE